MTQLGIDVSEHNGEIDWKKVSEEGIRFAIIRAGYGSAVRRITPRQKNIWTIFQNMIP